MAESWYTKEDILRGLQEVSPGRRVADIDDNGLVYADRQPPRPLAYENEEAAVELLFGHDADMLGQGDGKHQAAVPEPDLFGITQMLRMVQKYEHSSDDDSISSPGKNIVISKPNLSCSKITNSQPGKNCKLDNNGLTKELNDDSAIIQNKTVSIIEEKPIVQSKLNPNVKEFVPKFLQSFPSTLNSVNSSPSKHSCVSLSSTNNRSDITCESHDLESHDKHIADTKTQKNNEESLRDKREAAHVIKSQISTKNDTLEQQQKTNVAIVKLLKLYAEPKPKNTVKLLTPSFFEKSIGDSSRNELKANISKSDDKRCESKHCDNVETLAGVQRMTSLHDVVQDSCITVPSKSQENSLNCTDLIHQNPSQDLNRNNACQVEVLESTNLTPNLASCDLQSETAIPESQQEVDDIDPFVKESIEKVNNWFNDKPVATVNESNNRLSEKPVVVVNKEKSVLSPVLNMSAVAFKRKDSSPCKSPCEITKKVPKAAVAEYRPSSYAQELHKKYSERSNVSSPVPVLNIWEQLEADLKKKDAEIMNRKKKSETFIQQC